MPQHRIVIRHPRPWLRYLAFAGGALLLMGVSLLAHRYLIDPDTRLFRDPATELEQLREERRRLTRELRAARDALDGVQGQKVFEARACDIDVQACEALRNSVTELEHEVADLREQLAFYRNIVSPEQARAGVRVLRLNLSPGTGADVWRYDLVLVQPVRRDRTAAGRFDLQIEGLAGDQLRTLPLDEVLVGDMPLREFAFRSFQEFGGELRLPAGFRPSRVTVTLRVQNGRGEAAEVVESFDWSRLVAAGKE